MKKGTTKAAYLVTALSVAGFLGVTFYTAASDDKAPVLNCDSQILNVTVDEIIQGVPAGVTAHDQTDGDLTSSVQMTGHSMFLENGVFRACFAAADSRGNMGKLEQLICITDYQPPCVHLRQAPVFAAGTEVSIKNIVEVSDVLDGVIADNESIYLSNSINTGKEGMYEAVLQTGNSFGDVITQVIPVWIVPAGDGPDIELSEYMVYIEEGSTFDAESYIQSVTGTDGVTIRKSKVEIDDSALDLTQSGTYLVKYTCTQGETTGYSALSVVVTEKGQ